MAMRWIAGVLVGLCVVAGSGGANAAKCGGDFDTWLAAFKVEAVAAGVPQGTVNSALNGMTPSAAILKLDRNQHYFKQSFETYRARRVNSSMLNAGFARLRADAALLKRIEKRYGVPGSIVVAIWGLETGYGGYTGKTPAIRSLVTLAHDCRRADFFRNELIAALKVIARGDLSVDSMVGGWAGEVGQTQFMPSSYEKYAVDFDGNGRRDLIHSSADALASTANYLKGYGWKAGAPYGEGSANFGVLNGWNKADVYKRTIVWFAAQLDGK